MKKIYIKGYYGNENLGDDIFTVTAGWVCEKYWKNYEPIFIGESLPHIKYRHKRVEFKSIYLRNIIELVLLFFTSKVIYFGGSLFSKGGDSFLDLKYYIKKIPIFYKKTFAIGVSIGPFLNEKDYTSTKELVDKMKHISVRDYKSVEILKKMDLKENYGFSFDPAILIDEVYDLPPIVKARKDGKIIGISITRNSSSGSDKDIAPEIREESLRNTIDLLLQQNINIKELVFIIFNGNKNNGDVTVTKEFYNYFKSKVNTSIIEYSCDTESMINEISKCDFILGTRLHSCIIAYALKIPFILFEYHTKCEEFLNTINHGFRYDLTNASKNIKHISLLLEKGYIPETINPEYFKEIMIEELKKLA